MASIQTGIELHDGFTNVLNSIIGSVSLAVSAMEDMRWALDAGIDTSALESARMEIDGATMAANELEERVRTSAHLIADEASGQRRFNREIDRGVGSAGRLRSAIAGTVGAFAWIAGIRKAVGWIEECTEAFDTQRNAELQLMNVLANTDGRTAEIDVTADTSGAVGEINSIQDQASGVAVDVSADTGALRQAFSAITEKASEIQSRGIYGDEAMIAGAAEFSTYFSDTEAIEMMMDTLADYAMGMSGGGALDTKAMVDYATGLGKIMSGSYEAMTKKGFEFTEAQKAVIEGTASQEQIISAIGEEYLDASADIQAAAAINAVIAESWDGLYESMSNTPEGKIIQMTNAWGDMKEVVGSKLYPYVVRFVDVITENWPTIQRVVDEITGGLQFMMGVLSWLLEGAFNFAQVVIDNWSWISPIIYGIIAALAVYGTYLAITKGIEIASAVGSGVLAIGKGLLAAATMVATGATWAETTAQMGLNGAMYACPIVWIVILIIALVAAFYAAIAAINKFAGTSISATGVICGVFASWVAFVVNRFIMIYNYVMSLVEWFANVWNDPVYSTKRLFVNLAEMILDFCIAATEGFDDVATNLANAFISGANLAIEGINWIIDALNMIPGVDIGKIDELDKVASITSSLRGMRDSLESWLGEESDDYVRFDRMDYVTIGDAWNAGYSFGEGVEEKIANFDPASLFEDYMRELGEGMDSVPDDTSAIRDALDITQEDLKYLRDIAEQEAVNRFTTAEIHVDMSGMQNSISSGDDIDGFVAKLTDSVNEAVDSMAEGVHG